MRTAMTILVVEDDPAVLLLISKMLEPTYHVVMASGVNTALERMFEQWPDGFIVDIHLPGMGGTDVLQLLRAHPASRHTPAIAITGDPDIDEAELRARGFTSVVRKPFTAAQLREAVEYFIG